MAIDMKRKNLVSINELNDFSKTFFKDQGIF